MQERHTRRDLYFKEQSYTTKRHILPFLLPFIKTGPGFSVLEIGCGEGGNMKPFLDAGCRVTGIDILPEKISNAEYFFKDHPARERLELIAGDIYDAGETMERQFDLVYMRDVIEHIHSQETFMNFVKKFLKKDGKIFIAFPPWQNPFGGHQQVCRSKFLSSFPFFHLLPGPLYPAILRLFREPWQVIEGLLEIKETALSIERFKRIIRNEKYNVERELFYLINPHYEVKFGLKPRQQCKFLARIPWIRNFFTSACYYLLSAETGQAGK